MPICAFAVLALVVLFFLFCTITSHTSFLEAVSPFKSDGQGFPQSGADVENAFPDMGITYRFEALATGARNGRSRSMPGSRALRTVSSPTGMRPHVTIARCWVRQTACLVHQTGLW